MDDLWLLPLRRIELLEDRQDDASARPADRGAEGCIVFRVGAGAEIDIEGDAIRPRGDKPVDERGMITPWPRPAIQRFQASRVDFNNDNFLARLAF